MGSFQYFSVLDEKCVTEGKGLTSGESHEDDSRGSFFQVAFNFGIMWLISRMKNVPRRNYTFLDFSSVVDTDTRVGLK